MSKANKQVKPLVYNHHYILSLSPDQAVEKIGIGSYGPMDLERGRAVELHLWWTAGTTALIATGCLPFRSPLPKSCS